jgi:hypothetical protein
VVPFLTETDTRKPSGPANSVRLKINRPVTEDIVTAHEIVFGGELIAKMFANRAAHGMTLHDLAI